MLAIVFAFFAVIAITWSIQVSITRNRPPLILISRYDYGVHRPGMVTAMNWTRLVMSLLICIVFYFDAPAKILPDLLVVFGSIAAMVLGTIVFWKSGGRPFRVAGRLFFVHSWEQTTTFEVIRETDHIVLRGQASDLNDSSKPTIDEVISLSGELAEALCAFIRSRFEDLQIDDRRAKREAGIS